MISAKYIVTFTYSTRSVRRQTIKSRLALFCGSPGVCPVIIQYSTIQSQLHSCRSQPNDIAPTHTGCWQAKFERNFAPLNRRIALEIASVWRFCRPTVKMSHQTESCFEKFRSLLAHTSAEILRPTEQCHSWHLGIWCSTDNHGTGCPF
jgi:hypothetical protein